MLALHHVQSSQAPIIPAQFMKQTVVRKHYKRYTKST